MNNWSLLAVSHKAVWPPNTQKFDYISKGFIESFIFNHSPYQVGSILERECVECKGSSNDESTMTQGYMEFCGFCEGGIQRYKILGPIDLIHTDSLPISFESQIDDLMLGCEDDTWVCISPIVYDIPDHGLKFPLH